VTAFIAVLVILGISLSLGGMIYALGRRPGEPSLYDRDWGWLLPGGFWYKLGKRDTSSRERVLPYVFGGLFDGFMYNSGRVRRRREEADRGDSGPGPAPYDGEPPGTPPLSR
jgi:hypothetical protein